MAKTIIDSIENAFVKCFTISNTTEPNIFNSKGLPNSCFRSDNWVITLN